MSLTHEIFLLFHILTNSLIILVGEKRQFIVVLICTSLVTKRLTTFLCLLALWISSFAKCLFQVSCLFLKMILVLFRYSGCEFLVDFCSNIFSHSVLPFSYSLIGVFGETQTLCFNVVKCMFCNGYCFLCTAKESFPTVGLKLYYY